MSYYGSNVDPGYGNYEVSGLVTSGKGGTLSFHTVYHALPYENIRKYELEIEGTVYSVSASEVKDGILNITLPAMEAGEGYAATLYAVDANGGRSEGATVSFDVADDVAPVLNGKLAMFQTNDAFTFAWEGADDDSAVEYKLVIKDAEGDIVYEGTTVYGTVVSFDEIKGYIDAHYENKQFGIGQYTAELTATQVGNAELVSNKLIASASVVDVTAPWITGGDSIDAESKLNNAEAGKLTIENIDDIFADDIKIAGYEFVVDGKVYEVKEGVVAFDEPLSYGDKTGKLYALDAAGNRSAGVAVNFGVADMTAPVLDGELAMTMEDTGFRFSWAAGTDEREFAYKLTLKYDDEVKIYDIPDTTTTCFVDLGDMSEFAGQKFTAELTAYQQDAEGEELVSNKLSSSFEVAENVWLEDMEMDNKAPEYVYDGEISAVLKDGVLTMESVDGFFTDDRGIAKYEVQLGGETHDISAAQMAANDYFRFEDVSGNSGTVTAVDGAGNICEKKFTF